MITGKIPDVDFDPLCLSADAEELMTIEDMMEVLPESPGLISGLLRFELHATGHGNQWFSVSV